MGWGGGGVLGKETKRRRQKRNFINQRETQFWESECMGKIIE